MRNIKSGGLMKTRLTKAVLLLWAGLIMTMSSVLSLFLCNYLFAIK